MSKIIMLCGYAQSGKDTVAQMLRERGYDRLAFADPIRNALYTLDPLVTESGLTVSDIVDKSGWDVAKVAYPEIRRLLQVLGTEVAREQWSDSFWVDLAFNKMDPDRDYVITDCRFPNELSVGRAHNAILWRVVRPGTGPVNSHASDNLIDDFDPDYTINNSGSRMELRWEVQDVLDSVTWPVVH